MDLDFWNPRKYNGDKVKKALGLNNIFSYLFYGRPGITKGVEYLVEAVPIIKKLIPDSKLILILSEDPRNRFNVIKKMIKKLKIEKNIVFLGSKKRVELPNYILAANCVVVPSLTEGFGYCAIEASMLNKTVISTRVGAIPEINPDCIFIEPKSELAIAQSVYEVFKTKKTSKKVSDNLRKKLDKKEILQSYLKAIDGVLN